MFHSILLRYLIVIATMMTFVVQGLPTMKNITVIELPPDQDVVTTTDTSKLGIRVLFNEGMEPESDDHCSASELYVIHDIVVRTIGFVQIRKLSSLRGSSSNGLMQRNVRSMNCANVCKGYAPGTCVRGHPQCKGYRNLQDVVDTNDREILDAAEENNGAALDRCDNMMKQTKVALQLILSMELSKSCVSLLLEPISLKCMLFES